MLVSTLPAESPTTHARADGQEAPVIPQKRPELGSTGVLVHAAAPPAGSPEVHTAPAVS